MVTRNYYSGEEDPVVHRYSSRGNGYPMSDLPPGLGVGRIGSRASYQMAQRDKRQTEQQNEKELNNPNPRKRIPVAVSWLPLEDLLHLVLQPSALHVQKIGDSAHTHHSVDDAGNARSGAAGIQAMAFHVQTAKAQEQINAYSCG